MRTSALSLRHFAYAALTFVLLQVLGIVGFALITDAGIVDAFYRTVVYVSTVGLDTLPETDGEKIFAIVLVSAGVALYLYVIGLVIQLNVAGVVTGVWQERRSRRATDRMERHYLVCGYGRVGREVGEEFRRAGVPFVVIDRDPAVVALAREAGDVAVEGNATEDDSLERAGVGRARGLVACVESDAENLFIVLSAREVNPDLLIVARASNEEAGTKLRRGGADRIVSPYGTAGKELATLVLKPHVAAFLEVLTSSGHPELQLEEIEVTAASVSTGMALAALPVDEGATIIAHRRRGGEFVIRPDPATTVGVGDVLIGVGTPSAVQALEELFRPVERGA